MCSGEHNTPRQKSTRRNNLLGKTSNLIHWLSIHIDKEWIRIIDRELTVPVIVILVDPPYKTICLMAMLLIALRIVYCATNGQLVLMFSIAALTRINHFV